MMTARKERAHFSEGAKLVRHMQKHFGASNDVCKKLPGYADLTCHDASRIFKMSQDVLQISTSTSVWSLYSLSARASMQSGHRTWQDEVQSPEVQTWIAESMLFHCNSCLFSSIVRLQRTSNDMRMICLHFCIVPRQCDTKTNLDCRHPHLQFEVSSVSSCYPEVRRSAAPAKAAISLAPPAPHALTKRSHRQRPPMPKPNPSSSNSEVC